MVEKFWRWDLRALEEEKFLPGRKKFWGWMVSCVEASPLNLKHLVAQADRYDVAHLFKIVKEFLAVENPHTFAEKVNAFFYCEAQRGEELGCQPRT